MKNLLSEYKKIAKHCFNNFKIKEPEEMKRDRDFRGHIIDNRIMYNKRKVV